MLKKVCILLWDFMGDLRLTIYLLISSALLFFTGAYYSNLEFTLLANLNEMRIQDWMTQYLISGLDKTWWLPLLIIVLAILGINTFICSWNRIRMLITHRNRMHLGAFMINLTPSIIHCLFLTVMLGHAMTSTLGSWQRISLEKGEVISISDQHPNLIVDSIESEYFPKDSNMRERIKQTTVKLKNKDGNIFQVSFLNYLSLKGYHLHLDMNKKRQKGKDKKKPGSDINEPETCNKAHIFHVTKRQERKTRKLFLLVTDDPGLYIIITSFVLILILMLWYFIEYSRKKSKTI